MAALRVVGQWLIARTCLGYLLHLHRIGVTAVALILVFAGIYWFGTAVSDDKNDWIYYAASIPQSELDAGRRAEWMERHGWMADGWRDPLYFSIMSFVTLGYGDFAPVGVCKLITGIEALLGVTLLSLFTVGLGRKLVR